MTYFEFQVPEGDGICANNSCPCKNSRIPSGTGYLYISREAVEFRRDCLSLEEFRAKMDRLISSSRSLFVVIPQHQTGPVLLCEKSAKLINLNLESAAVDAENWWKTGKVPLRPTPQIIMKMPKKWWNFWK